METIDDILGPKPSESVESVLGPEPESIRSILGPEPEPEPRHELKPVTMSSRLGSVVGSARVGLSRAKDFIKEAAVAPVRGLGIIGKGVAAAVADVQSAIGNQVEPSTEQPAKSLGPYTPETRGLQGNTGGNLIAWLEGRERTPMRIALDDQAKIDQANKETLNPITIGQEVTMGAAEMTPKLATMSIAGGGLVAQSALGGALFGIDDKGNFNAKHAAFGALMPGVGRVAQMAAAKSIATAMRRGVTQLDNVNAQKLIEFTSEQAAQNAWLTAQNTPEYIELAKRDPEAFKRQFAVDAGSNLALMILGVPKFGKNVPSATQNFFRAKGSEIADQFMTNPRYRDRIDQLAIDALTPKPAPLQDIPIDDRIAAVDASLKQFEDKLGPRDQYDDKLKRAVPSRIVAYKEQELLDLREKLQREKELQENEAKSSPAQPVVPPADAPPVQPAAAPVPAPAAQPTAPAQPKAKAVIDSLPPVRPGFVRMFHGGADPTGNLNGDRDISPDYDYAAGYAAKSKGAKVWYVDVPESAPYMKKGFEEPRAPWINTVAPADVMKGARLVERTQPAAKPSDVAKPKPLPKTVQITVQAPQDAGDGEIVPGYVQIDFFKGNENSRSTNPDTLRAEGFDVPDFSSLPQGRYTLKQAADLLKGGAPVEKAKGQEVLKPSPEPSKAPEKTKPVPAPERPGERELLEEWEASGELTEKSRTRLEELRQLELEQDLTGAGVKNRVDSARADGGAVAPAPVSPAAKSIYRYVAEKSDGKGWRVFEVLTDAEGNGTIRGDVVADGITKKAAEAERDKLNSGLKKPAAQPEPPKPEAPKAKLKKDADFDFNGIWHVTIGDQTYRIFHDKDSKYWYDINAREAVKNPDSTVGLLSVSNRKEALEKLAESGVPNAPKAEPGAKPAERTLDNEKGNTFGPAFDDRIGDIPDFKKEADPWFAAILKGARVDDKSPKSATRRTIVVRDNETGELHELSIWDNNGVKVTDPKTGKGTDAAKFLRKITFDKNEKAVRRYDVVATLRYAEPAEGVRRTITTDELIALKDQFDAINKGVDVLPDEVAPVNPDTGEVVGETGIAVKTKEELTAKKKATPAPSLERAEAVEVMKAIGEPRWKNKDGGRDIIANALFDTPKAAKFVTEFMEWVRRNDLNTLDEVRKLTEKIYESIERTRKAIKAGEITPDKFNEDVLDAISVAKRRAAEEAEDAGADSDGAGPEVPERAPAANLGAGLKPGEGLTREAATQALAGEDTHGVEVQVISKEEAVAITGYQEAAGYGGFEWKGKAYLVHENIGSAAKLKEVLREEVSHALMQTPQGKKLVADAIEAGAIKLTDKEKQALRDRGYQEDQLVDEFIAQSAREQQPWWRRAVESVRVFLSKAGIVNLTNAEASRLLLRRIQASRNGEPVFAESAFPRPSEARPADENDRTPTVVMGDVWYVNGRETTVTPEDVANSTAYAKRVLDEVGIPAVESAVNTRGTPENPADRKALWVWRDTGEDQSSLNLKGRALAQRLAEDISNIRSTSELGPRLGALLNSIVRNFDLPDSAMARMSTSVRNELFRLAQTERSYRGALLGELSRFRDDLRRVSLNVDVYLNRMYSDAFGGDVVETLVNNARRQFGEEVTPQVAAEEVAKVPEASQFPNAADVLSQASKQNFGSMEELQAIFSKMLSEQNNIPPDQANTIAAKVMDAFKLRARMLAAKAYADQERALTVKQLRELRLKSSGWFKVEKLVNKGMFDAGAVMKELAAKRGWKPPTDEEVARMKEWAIREQRLLELTESEEMATGGDPVKLARARIVREEATRPEREVLLRKMEAQWARMTKPTSFAPHRWFNEMYRKNNAAFINEWVSSNLLFRLSFATKQAIDVVGQFAIHTPTRAVATAIEMQRDAVARGDRPDMLTGINDALSVSLRDSMKAYGDAIKNFDVGGRAARAAFTGRNRVRNVDKLMSGQASIERMMLAADDAWSSYKRTGDLASAAKATALRVLAFTRFSYRVAQSLDALSGTMVERQEMRRQLVRELRNAGKTRAEAESQADVIMSISTAEHAQAMAEAKLILDAAGRKATPAELAEAADRIMRRWQYEKMRQLKLPADDFAMQNDFLRDTVGWNNRETTGLGGYVGKVVTGAGHIAENFGLPLPIGRFGNAIAIGINRALTFTPAGFFPHIFGGESNAWFKTELDRTQRKVEAAAGTLAGATLISLVMAGVITVRNRWPKDKEERDVWEREGRRPGTVEFNVGDGRFIPVSMTTGPLRLVAPYLAGAGALHDLLADQDKKQQRLNEEAAKLGIEPGKVKPLGVGDLLGVAGNAAYTTLLGGRTSAGLVGSLTDYGSLNVNKVVSGQVSPLVIGLPAYQEATRMAGITLESKMASVWDFLVPLPTSPARRVNFLGDPAETPDDLQRIVQVMTGGTAGVVTPSDAKIQNAYAVLFNSEFRPPSIEPGKGYAIGGTVRPLTDDELRKYTVARGQNFKEALAGMSPDADAATVRAAFNEANRRALESVGVSSPSAARTSPAPQGSSAGYGAGLGAARQSASASTSLGPTPVRTGLSGVSPFGSRLSATRSSSGTSRLSRGISRRPRLSSSTRRARARTRARRTAARKGIRLRRLA